MKNVTDWSKCTASDIRSAKSYAQLFVSLVCGVVNGLVSILYCVLATILTSGLFVFYLVIFALSIVAMPFCFIYDYFTSK